MEDKLHDFVAFTFKWKLVLKGILGVTIWFPHSPVELEFKVDFFDILYIPIQRTIPSNYKLFLVIC